MARRDRRHAANSEATRAEPGTGALRAADQSDRPGRPAAIDRERDLGRPSGGLPRRVPGGAGPGDRRHRLDPDDPVRRSRPGFRAAVVPAAGRRTGWTYAAIGDHPDRRADHRAGGARRHRLPGAADPQGGRHRLGHRRVLAARRAPAGAALLRRAGGAGAQPPAARALRGTDGADAGPAGLRCRRTRAATAPIRATWRPARSRAPPCRAVDLRRGPGLVVLAAHSQGTVISMAALLGPASGRPTARRC